MDSPDDSGQKPGPQVQETRDPLISRRRYRRLWISSVLATSIVSIAPLLIMTWLTYQQYGEAFHEQLVNPIHRFTSNAKYSLEFFISDRISALEMAFGEKSIEELCDEKKINRLLKNMKNAFAGFIDLGLITANGEQISYSGPYRLKGTNYSDSDWFQEVNVRGVYVSDVFLGHRKFPHFIIAIKHDTSEHESYILRATIDTELFNRQIPGLKIRPSSDAFIVNRSGVLQTASKYYGDVLSKIDLDLPHYSDQAEVMEVKDKDGKPLILGYAYVDKSPFIVMLLSKPGTMQESWVSLRRKLLMFLSVSIVLILAAAGIGTKVMISRMKEADLRRATVFHKMEYTNRMAVIGRLAAGVAHEINNPLTIINEKAGLLGDLLSVPGELPPKEKLLSSVESVLKSVNRCSRITKRLLGFAKHMDVQLDKLDTEHLIVEVLGFLEKEAHYRKIQVDLDMPEDLPTIESDRGQLQQVFLNIVNNAFAAMEDGGKLDISAREVGVGQIAVRIEDNGSGIPADNLEHIFEPFFTTKKGQGTGLGLSITYGIVEKLGGKLEVESTLGEGTCFTVTLPVQRSDT
ncbi:MAG: two-component sensor histidine kinase [Proteobacteria bacterium]|nr:two-component sensor histidine kinase [Pseudomonadota bacterium]